MLTAVILLYLSLATDFVQRVKHNTLESVYLVTSLFVLLAGMTFQSGVAVAGSGSYVVLTYLVAFVLVACVGVFVGVLGLELWRSFRYTKTLRLSTRARRASGNIGTQGLSSSSTGVVVSTRAGTPATNADWVTNPLKRGDKLGTGSIFAPAANSMRSQPIATATRYSREGAKVPSSATTISLAAATRFSPPVDDQLLTTSPGLFKANSSLAGPFGGTSSMTEASALLAHGNTGSSAAFPAGHRIHDDATVPRGGGNGGDGARHLRLQRVKLLALNAMHPGVVSMNRDSHQVNTSATEISSSMRVEAD